MELKLTQTNQNIEQNVSTSIVTKLYNIALQSPPQSLSGNITLNGATYKEYVDYLTSRYPDLIITSLNGQYYIKFKDPEVERILVEVYGDGVGVTSSQLPGISLSGVFKYNKDITTFPEFDKFTLANTNPNLDLFYDCNNLEYINLKNAIRLSAREFAYCGKLNIPGEDLYNIQEIGESAFRECQQLEIDLNLPNLTKIYQYAFSSSGVKNVLNLGSVTEIPSLCFLGCYNLQSVNMNGITKLGQQCFWDTTINNLDISNVVSFGTKCLPPSNQPDELSHDTEQIDTQAFWCEVSAPNVVWYLPKIKRFQNDKIQYQLGSYIFKTAYHKGSSKLGQLYFKDIIFDVSDQGYQGGYYGNGPFSSLTVDLVYFKSIDCLRPGITANCKIKAFVINQTTPPDLYSHTINGQDPANNEGPYLNFELFVTTSWTSWYNIGIKTEDVYVPDSAVDTYKTTWREQMQDTYDKFLTGRSANETVPPLDDFFPTIHPISELQQYATEQDWIDAGRPLALITEYM